MSLYITITNDGTGDETTGNYRYEVAVNGRVIDRGAVTGHDRTQPWHKLAAHVAEDGKLRHLIAMIRDA